MRRETILILLFVLILIGIARASNIFSVTVSPSEIYEYDVKNFTITVTNNGNLTICEVNISVFNFTIKSVTDRDNWSYINGSDWIYWNTSGSCITSGGASVPFELTLQATEVKNDVNTTWKIWTSNRNGEENTTFFNVTILNDDVFPLLRILSPQDNFTTNQSVVVFNISCSDNVGLSVLQLWADWTGMWHANLTNSSPTNGSAWSANLTVPEGIWKWAGFCNDTAGNGNWSENRTLIVDITKPDVDLTQPKNGDWVSGILEIKINASDAVSGIDYVKFWNGTAWDNASLKFGDIHNGVWNGSINTSLVADGDQIVIDIIAVDKAGNKQVIQNASTIRVDNSPANILSFTSNDTIVKSGDTIYLSADVEETHSKINSCWIFLYYGNGTKINIGPYGNLRNDCKDDFTLPQGLTDGNYIIMLRVNNTAGLLSFKNLSIEIDNTPPLIFFVSPTPSDGSSQTSKTLRINVSHSDKNLEKVVLTLNNQNTTYDPTDDNHTFISLNLDYGTHTFKVCVNDSADNWNCTEQRSVSIYTPPSSGGGGASMSFSTSKIVEKCEEKWSCTEWSECIDGKRTRTCVDLNDCGTFLKKPLEIEACAAEEIEEENICEVGERICANSTVMECNGKEWIAIKTCDSGCSNGKCVKKKEKESIGITGYTVALPPGIAALLVGIIIVFVFLYLWHSSIRFRSGRFNKPVY